MFIFANQFLENIVAWRSAWIGGRLGGGKTLLAIAIADWLIQKKLVDGAWTNFPCGLPAAKTIRRCVFILDESWQFIDSRLSRNMQSVYGAWARKLGSFWLFPSIYPPDNRVRCVTVARTTELLLSPKPMWIYDYHTLSTDKRGNPDVNSFVLLPQRYFGMYDTTWIPWDDGGISRAINDMIREHGIKLQGEKHGTTDDSE